MEDCCLSFPYANQWKELPNENSILIIIVLAVLMLSQGGITLLTKRNKRL